MRKYLGKIVIITTLLLTLTSCSLEEKLEQKVLSFFAEEGIEAPKQEENSQEEETTQQEADTELDLSSDLNQGMNAETFEKLQELEKLAVAYKKENSQVEDSAALLVAKYLRSGNSNYVTTEWNMLAGTPDTAFDSYVGSHAKGELASFREEAKIIDPATAQPIEFSHLIASVNLALMQVQMEADGENEAYPYVDYGSWGGDILQLCAQIKAEGLDSSVWLENMKEKIGDENSAFNKDDFYADLDSCNIKDLFREEKSLSKVFYKYYYEILEKTSMNRCQYFAENHFYTEKDEAGLADTMSGLLLDKESVIMQTLLSMEGLDVDADAHLISTACEALAQKIIENKG